MPMGASRDADGCRHGCRRVEQGSLTKIRGESGQNQLFRSRLSILGQLPSDQHKQLWTRGGFPDSLLATDDQISFQWRLDFIRTYLERDIPQLGPCIPPETLRRFWVMLAHNQSELLNAAKFASALGVDGQIAKGFHQR